MKRSLRHYCGASADVRHYLAASGTTALRLSILGFFTLFCGVSLLQAADVTLAWDPPTRNADGTTLTDLAGYKIYYGTASHTYTAVVNAGMATSTKVTGVQSGQTFYFAVTAYDTAGNESAYSAETAWTLPLPNPSMNISLQSGGVSGPSIALQWSSTTGRYYTVQKSTDLTAVPAFTVLAAHLPGQDPVTVYTDTAATGSGPYYYRIQLEP